MYNVKTQTGTYTVLDIRKTFEGCIADLQMIARRTGKWDIEKVDKVAHDILELAEKEYLFSVDIVLLNTSNNQVIKASKFTVNSDGSASSSDRAGKNNDWQNIENTDLSIILAYTQKWKNLLPSERILIQKDFKMNWSSSSIDNTFPHLQSVNKQLYASKGYELQKTEYK